MGYVEEEEEKKESTNYRNYVQHGFQTHTHPDRLIDERNELPKIKGGNKGRHKGGTIWNGLTFSSGSVAKGRADRVA